LKGERQVSLLKAAILSELEKEKGVRLEYLELVAGDTLRPVDTAAPGTMALLAVWIGRTRLIDNHSFSGGPETK
jgi:pantoate--beta-alanine ligase